MRRSPYSVSVRVGLALIALSVAPDAPAQDIEPRRWTPLPVGLNVIGAGLSYGQGDIAFDPALQIEDATIEVKSAVVSYLHAFGLFGNSARVDVLLPYSDARWEGVLNGQAASTERSGFGDPRVRLSVNFLGAPALSGKEYQAWRASQRVSTVAGVALAVRLPLGEYKRDRLLNLGGNRFVFRPQIGVVHTRGHWSYELTGSVLLYTDNDEFAATSTREQAPVFALQNHVVYASPKGWWWSAGAAYDWGGKSTIDGVDKDDRRAEVLFGLSAGFSINRRYSVKIAYVGRRSREEIGGDSDNVAVAWSVRF